MKSFLDNSDFIVMAHRGGDERFPENTMAAFQYAYDLGCRYFETDVYLTAGQELVAFHDNKLKRATGRPLRIVDMTVEERTTTLLDNNYTLPLLSDLLATFRDVYFNIDAKHTAAVQPLIDVVKRHGAEQRVCLGSFSIRSTMMIRGQLPDVCTVAMPQEVLKLLFRGSFKRSTAAVCIEIPQSITIGHKRIQIASKRFIENAHTYGLKVVVWTINETEEMQRLIGMGADGVFTDKVGLLKQALEPQGLWRQG